ncbi:MAG: DUF2306 domain-containing protein [Gammaproteobacteria bacterium]|nr:DUF2306 domain-containing protein [Gammaproteobacteria bacterium]MDD9895785.1 DUF2306 domain-containing protein [Gammaproteobacteria bacterium]
MKAETVLSYGVGFLAIAGIGGSIFFMLRGGANESSAYFPTITNLHVIPGAIYLALAPLQFSANVRYKFHSYHRWAGRLLAVVAIVSGASILFLGVIIPYSGLPEQLAIGFFGCLFLFSSVRGFIAAQEKQIDTHREWILNQTPALGIS